jgi:hypothetical protein
VYWVRGGDTVQVMRPPRVKSTQNTRGGYSKDTQIRAPDNGGYTCALSTHTDYAS